MRFSSLDSRGRVPAGLEKGRIVGHREDPIGRGRLVLGALVERLDDSRAEGIADVLRLLGVLGLPLERPEQTGGSTQGLVDALVEMRDTARNEKNWALSDAIRDLLAGQGIEIRDGG